MSTKEENVNLNPKKISVAVNRAATSGFQADTSSDEAFLKKENHSWDELNKLKDEVAEGTMKFVMEVTELTRNESIINNLGDKLKDFTATVSLFFKDIGEFSEKVRVLRARHEHLSGPITDMVSYNQYNQIAFEYHGLCNELAILVAPTISQLILIASEAIDPSKASETPTTVIGETVQ